MCPQGRSVRLVWAMGLAAALGQPVRAVANEPAWLGSVGRWMETQAGPCVVPLDWPIDSSGALPPLDAVSADTVAAAIGGAWTRIGGIAVLIRHAEADGASASAALSAQQRAALNLVEALPPHLLSGLAMGRPAPLSDLTAEQQALVAAIWPMSDDSSSLGTQEDRSSAAQQVWAIRLLVRPFVAFYRHGRPGGSVDLLAPCWTSSGYDYSRVCHLGEHGELLPVVVPDRLRPRQTRYHDLRVDEALVSAARPPTVLTVLPEASMALGQASVVALGDLAARLGTDRLVVDERSASWRLLVAPGTYEADAFVAAAASAYGLSRRSVDGLLFLSPPLSRPQRDGLAYARAGRLLDLVSARLQPLARSTTYTGLVLPATWFTEGFSTQFSALQEPAQHFVEDVWWQSASQAASSGRQMVFRSSGQDSAAWYYETEGAGDERTAARRLAIAELRDASLRFGVGYRMEMSRYTRSASLDSKATAWRADGAEVPSPLVSVAQTTGLDLYATEPVR